jgi:non-specific serine/threonine protein kinase
VSNLSASPLARAHANCLSVGARIAEYEITGLVGEGGFGVVYLARDTALNRVVALKEFMPSAFAGRIEGGRVAVRSAHHQTKFDAGLQGFIKEARMLARFNHPSLVKVYRFLEANGTAYMAMRFYDGQTLAQMMSAKGTRFDESLIAAVMLPVFDALQMLHAEKVFHRDIAPDNIMLADGSSVLLDFGSARHILGDGTQALTAVLKPIYSPVEQYVADGTMRQGAWTDVYALGAVLYHLATSKVPMQAVSRLMSDSLPTVSQVAGSVFSPQFSQAVQRAMAVRVEDRIQSISDLRQQLGWHAGMAQPVPSHSSRPAPKLAPAATAPALSESHPLRKLLARVNQWLKRT